MPEKLLGSDFGLGGNEIVARVQMTSWMGTFTGIDHETKKKKPERANERICVEFSQAVRREKVTGERCSHHSFSARALSLSPGCLISLCEWTLAT